MSVSAVVQDAYSGQVKDLDEKRGILRVLVHSTNGDTLVVLRDVKVRSHAGVTKDIQAVLNDGSNVNGSYDPHDNKAWINFDSQQVQLLGLGRPTEHHPPAS